MSSFLTQFRLPAKFVYKTPQQKIAARATRNLERHFALALPTGNWIRALEVLQNRKRVGGANPSHYAEVVKCITKDARDAMWFVEWCQEAVYSGEMEESGELWCSIVHAFCERGDAPRAMDALTQAYQRTDRRGTDTSKNKKRGTAARRSSRNDDGGGLLFTDAMKKEMSLEVLRVCASNGMAKESELIVDTFLPESSRSLLIVQDLLDEARGRAGDWRRVIEKRSSPSDARRRDAEEEDEETTSSSSSSTRLSSKKSLSNQFASSSLQQRLPRAAFEAMSMQAGMDGNWEMALSTLHHAVEGGKHRDSGGGGEDNVPSLDCVRAVLNSLGRHSKWEKAIEIFEQYGRRRRRWDGGGDMAVTTDRTCVNLLFASFPSSSSSSLTPRKDDEEERLVVTHVGGGGGGPESSGGRSSGMEEAADSSSWYLDAMLPKYEHPETIVAIFDDLLLSDDNTFFSISGYVATVVVPALVQRGNWERALHILKNSEPLSRRWVSGQSSGPVEKRLVQYAYALHAMNEDTKAFTMKHIPHVFPKEIYANASPSVIVGSRREEDRKVTLVGSSSSSSIRDHDDGLRVYEELRAVQGQSLRPNRQDYFKPRSTSAINADHHQKMIQLHSIPPTAPTGAFNPREDQVSLSSGGGGGGGKNPFDDPRPAPLDHNDHASGWDSYHHQGTMKVFTASKKVATPHNLWPKYMKHLSDPFRSWKPSVNSCHAHKETFKKWNGRSRF